MRPPSSRPPAAPALDRGIRRWDLVALVLNAVIGAGIFGLPARVYELAGPWSLVAFGACALVVALIVLCFAELGSRFESTGGPYVYVQTAFGPFAGFTVGWLVWLARVTAFAALSNLWVGYFAYFWPGAAEPTVRVLLITGIVVVLTLINVRGIRHAASVSNAFTIGKLLPLILFAVVGLFAIQPARLALRAAPPAGDLAGATLLLVFAFTGFEAATIPAGECRAPRRNLPFALLLAMSIVTVLYVAIQAVCIGTLPGLASSTRPLADAAATFLGPLGAGLIAAGALVSVTGTLNSIMISGPRLLYAMGSDHQLPRLLGATHARYRTPHASILVMAAVVLVVTLQGSFIAAVTMSSIVRLMSYAAICAALPALRRREREVPAGPDQGAGFRVPGGTWVAGAALVLCVWLISAGAWRESLSAVIAAAAGWVLHGAYRWNARRQPESVRRA